MALDKTYMSDKQVFVTANQINRSLDEALASSQIGSEKGIYGQTMRNSNFDVWTLGTSFTDPASGSETANGWFVIKEGTAPTINVKRNITVLPENKKSNYSCEFEVISVGTAGSTTEWELTQSIVEESAKFKNKTISVGFEVMASVPGIIGIKLGTGGVNDITTTMAVTTEWQTIKIENIYVGDITNLYLSIYLAGNVTEGFSSNFVPSSTGSIYVAQVQLNEGPLVMSYMPRMTGYEESLMNAVHSPDDAVLFSRKGVQGGSDNLKFIESTNTLSIDGNTSVSGVASVNEIAAVSISVSGDIISDGYMQTYSGIKPALMTESEINAIVSPAIGLLVYDTTNNLYKSWNGTLWTGLGGGAVSTVSDFNLLPAQGTMNIAASADITLNLPYNITDTWMVICSQYSAKKIQVAYAYSNPGLTMTRSYNGSTWTAWSAPYSQWFPGV